MKFTKGMVISAVTLLIVLVSFMLCSETIKPGYAGVVYNMNGGIESNVLTQGFHIVAPWKKIIEYPVASETVYFSKSNDEGKKGDTSLNVGTADGKNINMDVSYTFHCDPNTLGKVFTKFKGQDITVIEDTFLRRELKDAINSVTTQYGVFDIYGAKRSEVATKAMEAFEEKVKLVGFIVEGVSITEVNPDQATMQAIQQKVDAIQKLEQSKIEKQKAEIEAEKARVVAKGEADSKLIRAKGEADANRELQMSLTPELIEYTKAQKWDGKLPTVTSGNVLMNLQ